MLKMGFEAEGAVRELLRQKKHEYGQLDLVSIDRATQKIYIWEIKHQERFKAPPFDGHGLPPWQFKFRLEVARKTNTIPILIIVEPGSEPGSKKVFYQSLFILEKLPADKKFMTKTGKRIVFNIDAFNEMTL